MTLKLTHRPRRLRTNPVVRALIEENHLRTTDLVLPVFVCEDDFPSEIESMPGVFRWPIKDLTDKIIEWYNSGIKAFALFPKINPSLKSNSGLEILNTSSLIYRAASAIKALPLDLVLIADLALDPYTTHGQDGVLDKNGFVDNDPTTEILAEASLVCANAGFDWVAPSDMMDGRIGLIRDTLEKNSHKDVVILAYSAKFASSYYGPFRTAIGSIDSLQSIDKTSYQLNPANLQEAKRELLLDEEEGADILMIKPAEPFLDIIRFAHESFSIPIAAFQVSGEYSRIMAAHQLEWLDWKSCALESLLAIKRAGATLIFSYFADRLVEELS